jgi:hemolysin activation/secretion protein
VLDIQDIQTDVFQNLLFSKDHDRVARIGGTYNFQDKLRGVNTLDTQFSQGLDMFNASGVGSQSSNPFSPSDFRKINLDVSRLQPLPHNFSVLASASGQYAFDPLLVGEQFSLGGTGYGQAYDPGELLGDHGAAGKLEIRYGESPGYSYLESYQLFSYYDIGGVWLRDAAPGANDKKSLASVGAGVRADFMPNLSGSVEVDMPMTKTVTNQNDHERRPRLFFSAVAKF